MDSSTTTSGSQSYRSLLVGAIGGALIASAALLTSGARSFPAAMQAGGMPISAPAVSGGSWNPLGGSSGPSSADVAAATASCSASTLSRYLELRSLTMSGRGLSEGTPLLLDMVHGADACRGVPGVTPPVWKARDVCYVVAVTQPGLEYVQILNKTWPGLVPRENVVYVGREKSDRFGGVVHFDESSDSLDPWTLDALAFHRLYQWANMSHCQWWVSATDQDWVNPDALYDLLYGLRAEHPLAIGFVWHQMGWSHGVTYAGPIGVYSRAALAVSVGNEAAWSDVHGCTNRTGTWDNAPFVRDDFSMDACMWWGGAIHVHHKLFEPIGELGPGGSWSWQQPHDLMSWVAARCANVPRSQSLFMQYHSETYGPGKGGFNLRPDHPGPGPRLWLRELAAAPPVPSGPEATAAAAAKAGAAMAGAVMAVSE